MNRILTIAAAITTPTLAGPGGGVLVAEYTENFSVNAPSGDPSINIFSAVAIPGLFDPFDNQYLFGVENVSNGHAGSVFFYDLTQPAYAPHAARLSNGLNDELWCGADNQGGWGDYRTRSETSLFTGATAPDGSTIAGPDLMGFTPTGAEMVLNSISLTDNGFEVVGNASVSVRYYAEAPIPDPFDFSGTEFWDLQGDPDNTVLPFDLAKIAGLPSGTPILIESVAWDLVLTTIGASWASEATLGLDIDGDGVADLFINPGAADDTPVTAMHYADGPLPLGLVAPHGTMSIEFFETFDDEADLVDAVFEAGSVFEFVLSEAPSPCNPADLAEDFGILDLADITAFVTAFTTLNPAADIAPPFGTFDLADITAFVTAFTAGCP